MTLSDGELEYFGLVADIAWAASELRARTEDPELLDACDRLQEYAKQCKTLSPLVERVARILDINGWATGSPGSFHEGHRDMARLILNEVATPNSTQLGPGVRTEASVHSASPNAEALPISGPLLGLATTRELLFEVQTRLETNKYDERTGGQDFDQLGYMVELLRISLPKKVLDYRTVDSDEPQAKAEVSVPDETLHESDPGKTADGYYDLWYAIDFMWPDLSDKQRERLRPVMARGLKHFNLPDRTDRREASPKDESPGLIRRAARAIDAYFIPPDVTAGPEASPTRKDGGTVPSGVGFEVSSGPAVDAGADAWRDVDRTPMWCAEHGELAWLYIDGSKSCWFKTNVESANMDDCRLVPLSVPSAGATEAIEIALASLKIRSWPTGADKWTISQEAVDALRAAAE